MPGLEDDFPRPGTLLASKPVDDAAIGDRDEPGTERPCRIVGVPHGVHREQHFLHRVFDVPRILKVPCRDGTKIRRDVLEQAPVGIPVAGLRASHIDGPVELARGGSLWLRDECEVSATIVRACGHRAELGTVLPYIFCMAQSVSRSRSRYSAMHAASIGHAAKKRRLSNGARYC